MVCRALLHGHYFHGRETLLRNGSLLQLSGQLGKLQSSTLFPFTRVSALQLISLKWMMNNCTKQINCILGDEVRDDADRRHQSVFNLKMYGCYCFMCPSWLARQAAHAQGPPHSARLQQSQNVWLAWECVLGPVVALWKWPSAGGLQ